MAGKQTKNPEERFWAKVQKAGEDDCWLWTGAKCGKRGKCEYGQGSINSKKVMAHRLSYMFTYGELSDDLEVCHTCDNGLCVNPKHLWAGTHQQNMRDRDRKGRHAKLTESDVLEVRKLLTQGFTDYRIAKMFNVNSSAIYFIRSGQNWKYIHSEADAAEQIGPQSSK